MSNLNVQTRQLMDLVQKLSTELQAVKLADQTGIIETLRDIRSTLDDVREGAAAQTMATHRELDGHITGLGDQFCDLLDTVGRDQDKVWDLERRFTKLENQIDLLQRTVAKLRTVAWLGARQQDGLWTRVKKWLKK